MSLVQYLIHVEIRVVVRYSNDITISARSYSQKRLHIADEL